MSRILEVFLIRDDGEKLTLEMEADHPHIGPSAATLLRAVAKSGKIPLDELHRWVPETWRTKGGDA